MLKSLDVLIGFALIMLLVSLAVTAVTQFVTSALQWRGKHLRDGLVTLLSHIDPQLTEFCAEQIAGAVLTHPLIARANGGPGAVIQREELIPILLELAAGRESGGAPLDEFVRATLKRVLANRGIHDPEALLEDINVLAVKLERLHPEMSAAARHSLAIVTEASSQFVGRIHSWFDPTMDRVAHRFAGRTRAVTVMASAVIAVGLQLDSMDLLRRLAADDVLRNSLVAQAQTVARSGYAVAPEHWMLEWHPAQLPGIFLSMLLLSLGAPFWYSALKDLVRLRSPLERKEQEQRETRQTGPPTAFPALDGERGEGEAAG
jgi:hypothetical protein